MDGNAVLCLCPACSPETGPGPVHCDCAYAKARTTVSDLNKKLRAMLHQEHGAKNYSRAQILRWLVKSNKVPCVTALAGFTASASAAAARAQTSGQPGLRQCEGHITDVVNLRDLLKDQRRREEEEASAAEVGLGAQRRRRKPLKRHEVDPAAEEQARRQREINERQTAEARARARAVRQGAVPVVAAANLSVGMVGSMQGHVESTLATEQAKEATANPLSSKQAKKNAKRAAKRAEARAVKHREELVEQQTREAMDASLYESVEYDAIESRERAQAERLAQAATSSDARAVAAVASAASVAHCGEVVTTVMRAVGEYKVQYEIRQLGLPAMGFSIPRCCAALRANGFETDVDALVNWLMEVPEEMAPGVSPADVAGEIDVSEEMLELQEFSENMGVAREMIDAAVIAAKGDLAAGTQAVFDKIFANDAGDGAGSHEPCGSVASELYGAAGGAARADSAAAAAATAAATRELSAHGISGGSPVVTNGGQSFRFAQPDELYGGEENWGDDDGESDDDPWGTMDGGGAQSPPQERVAGYVFECDKRTEAQSIRGGIFGAPADSWHAVQLIQPDVPLFLYNSVKRRMLGIFVASSSGGWGIDANAFAAEPGQPTPLPAQVRVRIERKCPPLEERDYRHVFGGGARGGPINEAQVTQLRELLAPH